MDRGRGRAAGAHPPLRREGQLLADGRHRPVRSLLGNLLRLRSGRDRAGGGRPPVPGRHLALRRDLEPRLHGVRQGLRGQAASLAETVHRHGHGLGAHGCGAAGQAVELRHGPVPAPHRARRRAARRRVRRPGGDGHGPADRRRPRPRRDVSRPRRRHAFERGPGLRAAQDHPAGVAARAPGRARGPVPARADRIRGRPDAARLSGAAGSGGPDRSHRARRGAALRAELRRGRARVRVGPEQRAERNHPGQFGIPSVRHVRAVPGRAAGAGPRAEPRDRHRGLRRGDGAAARARARQLEGRRDVSGLRAGVGRQARSGCRSQDRVRRV